MRFLKTGLAFVALAALCALAACGGGGDVEDRLDVADPQVRFINVARLAANVTLYRNSDAQADATNVGRKFASRYFDVSGDEAVWSVRAATDPSAVLASTSLNPSRGNRDTIMVVPADSGLSTALIRDPYNKSLTSDDGRVRVFHAAPNAPAIDVYLTQPSADLASLVPVFPNLQFRDSMPPSGSDSFRYPGGTYQLRVTPRGTKTVIFSALLNLADNADWLLVPIPAADDGVPDTNAIKVLLVQGNRSDTVATEILSTR